MIRVIIAITLLNVLAACAVEPPMQEPPRSYASSGVPLPKRALLAAAPKPGCETAAVSEQQVAGAEQQGRAVVPVAQATPVTDANAALARLIAAEYERECYKQAEARVRRRLEALQSAVGRTIQAVEGQRIAATSPR